MTSHPQSFPVRTSRRWPLLASRNDIENDPSLSGHLCTTVLGRRGSRSGSRSMRSTSIRNLLEVVTLANDDDGCHVVIHAMKARKQYARLLNGGRHE